MKNHATFNVVKGQQISTLERRGKVLGNCSKCIWLSISASLMHLTTTTTFSLNSKGLLPLLFTLSYEKWNQIFLSVHVYSISRKNLTQQGFFLRNSSFVWTRTNLIIQRSRLSSTWAASKFNKTLIRVKKLIWCSLASSYGKFTYQR